MVLTFKILIIGTRTVVDAGETALLFTTLINLNKHFSHAKIVIGLTCEDEDFKKTLPRSILKQIRIIKSAKIRMHQLRVLMLILRCLPEYFSADLVLDISGDGFTDSAQYGFFGTFSHASQLLISIFLRKKTVVCAQSIGPFKKFFTRFLGYFVLNNVDLITVRENITERYLHVLGVTKPPLYLTADLAFMLDPTPKLIENQETIRSKHGKDRPLIGISISQIISTWAFPYLENQELQYLTYIKSMQEIINYILDKYDANAIFILHTTGKGARHDDSLAAKKIFDGIKHRERVKILNDVSNPAKIKRAVGECDLFIASKMHTAVEATTMIVPTVSIAYNYKVYGIIGNMLHQENLIVDIRILKAQDFIEEMIRKIDYAWENCEQIKTNLRYYTSRAREMSQQNIILITKFLNLQ